MDTAQVEALRALLAPSGWLERTRRFAVALRRRSRTPQGLLIVGTPAYEPWHMTAHIAVESELAGVPELMPTLVRWAPPPGAPPHLAVGLERIEQAGRTETLLVVSDDLAPAALLERVSDARKAGSSILALDQGDPELRSLVHESLSVPAGAAPVSFDAAQHLVSFAVGEPGRGALAGSLSRELLSDIDAWPDTWRLSPERLGRAPGGGAGRGEAAGAGAGLAGGVRGRLARLLNAISGAEPD
ncbi:MAG TPA: hypothetical protein VFQ44_04695 [Streptosporangiaceae bacterium]|nr:hypothetical protein [Streptosporangiaceae bacterium]